MFFKRNSLQALGEPVTSQHPGGMVTQLSLWRHRIMLYVRTLRNCLFVTFNLVVRHRTLVLLVSRHSDVICESLSCLSQGFPPLTPHSHILGKTWILPVRVLRQWVFVFPESKYPQTFASQSLQFQIFDQQRWSRRWSCRIPPQGKCTSPWKDNTAIKKTNENMLKRASLTGKPQNILEKPELINNHFRDFTDYFHVQHSNAFHFC